jgi:gamma-butyrobetaine dioxygenase
MQAHWSVTPIDDGAAIALTSPRGRRLRFHAPWLRDNMPGADSRDPVSGQRRLTLAAVPVESRVTAVAMHGRDRVHITFAPDGRKAVFPCDWLEQHAYDTVAPRPPGWLPAHVRTWDSGLSAALPGDALSRVRGGGDPLREWLASVRDYGVARLTGGPLEADAVLDVVALFGYVRETNYGRVFDVRTKVDAENLAYTGVGLQAHTDNPYRDPVPTLQLLYCMQNSVEGGDSIVVDGFRVARRLRDEFPVDFDLLTRHRARFEFAGSDGVHLQARRPIIELAADGELVAVAFNNRSIAPLVDVPYHCVPAYYDACRRFSDLVDDPAMAVRFRLEPGECFLVDNTRVLHARTAFSGNGSRWLRGCYADRDGLLSRLRVLEDMHRC